MRFRVFSFLGLLPLIGSEEEGFSPGSDDPLLRFDGGSDAPPGVEVRAGVPGVAMLVGAEPCRQSCDGNREDGHQR